jgi:hypothetical protein
LRFSETSATTALPRPWSGSSGGVSFLLFSPDDELCFGFFLLEKPKLKHQHIATKIQVSDRYALKMRDQQRECK